MKFKFLSFILIIIGIYLVVTNLGCKSSPKKKKAKLGVLLIIFGAAGYALINFLIASTVIFAVYGTYFVLFLQVALVLFAVITVLRLARKSSKSKK